LGSKARLALALLLWTGVRRSDLVKLGRQHVRDGWLRFTQQKNRKRKPVQTSIPILPELQRVIEASPTGDLTFLVTAAGGPYTVWGFGNWFRDRCVEAGVPGRAHGLRKAGAATAAENGATSKQLMAIFGWLSLDEAERYTQAAEREKLAKDAVGLLLRR
jgi:integrase